ncbi:MAG: ArnT family glycosyltransferase [Candidatus Binatia bacterium]
MSRRAASAAALAFAVALAAYLALPGLGDRPLYSAGEVRNALIAQEMLQSGDWLQPRLNAARYYEKPPLMYWSIAAAQAALGQTELAARLPAALAYILTVALVFLLGRELLGARGGLLSCLVFATAAAPYHFARFVSLDTVTTAALTLSVLGLAVLTRGDRRGSPPPGPAAWWMAATCFWLGAALAGLTKGLLGIAFPVASAALYAAAIGGRDTLRRLRPGLGAAILAAIWLPWHLALASRDPAFVPFYLLNEHVYRFLNIREPIDYAPLSVPGFWLASLLWFFPWALFLPGAVASAWHGRRRLAVPLIWAVWVIGFFTLARSRLEYYAQPAYPALAVLVAAYWLGSARRHRRRGLMLTSAVLGAGGIVVAVWLWLQPEAHYDITALVATADGYYREYFLKRRDRAFFFAQQALSLRSPFALWFSLLGAGALVALYLRRPLLAFACWVICLVPALGILDRGLLLIADDRAQKLAAHIIEERWRPDAVLVVAGTYEDAAGVTLYTGHRTHMLDGADGDMLFGLRQGDAQDLFLDRAEFDALWSSSARVFVFAQIEKIPADGEVLLDTPRHQLLVNH